MPEGLIPQAASVNSRLCEVRERIIEQIKEERRKIIRRCPDMNFRDRDAVSGRD